MNLMNADAKASIKPRLLHQFKRSGIESVDGTEQAPFQRFDEHASLTLWNMKFLALKKALEGALNKKETNETATTDRRCDLGDPNPGTPLYTLKSGLVSGTLRQTASALRTPVRTRVEGGIDRIPVDRTARVVIQPAPWWAKPINTMSKDIISTAMHPATGEGDKLKLKTEAEMDSRICGAFVTKADRALEQANDLYAKTCDARQALAVLADSWNVSWMDFIDTSNKRLQELRMSRMALETELNKLMTGFKDVRAFFLDKNYDTEITRLREFVSLCERLQTLKKSGFLDTVADTILKLS